MMKKKGSNFESCSEFLELMEQRKKKYGVNGTMELVVDGKTSFKRWTDRHVAVGCFIFCRTLDLGRWFVLLNKRGPNAPDFQGKWNAPCGYLEKFETAQEGCTRETMEETSIFINPMRFVQIFTQTDPHECNHGNVTLRHVALLPPVSDESHLPEIRKESLNHNGGEDGEVSDARWVSLYDIEVIWDDDLFAFGHQGHIIDIANNYLRYLPKENPERRFYETMWIHQISPMSSVEGEEYPSYEETFGLPAADPDNQYYVLKCENALPDARVGNGLTFMEAKKLRDKMEKDNQDFYTTFEIRLETE